jgi:hypothetical protein
MRNEPSARGRTLHAAAPTLPSDPRDAATLLARVLAAAEAALAQAAATPLDAADAQTALKHAERLARTAAGLARTRAQAGLDAEAAPPPPDAAEAEAERAAILARISRALEGGRQARRLQVAAMEARGIDPRQGWRWDTDKGDWVWDPGAAMAGGG